MLAMTAWVASNCHQGYSPHLISTLKPGQSLHPPNIVTPKEQAYFRVLRAVELNPDITQPQLARQLGISMGKANYLINALIDKGLIKIGNFHRRSDKLNKIAYLLTPEGLKNRTELTRNYLTRKETEYEALKAEIESLRAAEAELPANAATAAGKGRA
jgi:EPS-associated MarR family transcriptional regulator